MNKPNKIDYNGHPCTFSLYRYRDNDNLAVQMTTYIEGYPEPYAMITRNLGIHCRKDCAFIDSNNLPGIGRWLIREGLAHATGRCQFAGYCVYDEYKFDMDKIKEYVTEDDYNE
jgi:hypothetical protein